MAQRIRDIAEEDISIIIIDTDNSSTEIKSDVFNRVRMNITKKVEEMVEILMNSEKTIDMIVDYIMKRKSMEVEFKNMINQFYTQIDYIKGNQA